jgi:hypothetical protein
MALAFAIRDRGAAGDLFSRIVDITLDNAYPAGGWPVTPANLGFGTNGVIMSVSCGPKGGFSFEWDEVNSKIICRDSSGAANTATPVITTVTVANAIVLRCVCWGKGQG